VKLIIFCDYQPALLDGFFKELDVAGFTDRLLIRKMHVSRWRDINTQVGELFVPIFHEESPRSLAAGLSIVIYLVCATITGIIEVLKNRIDGIVGIYAFPQGLAAALTARATRHQAAILTDGGDIDILLGNHLIRSIITSFLRGTRVVTVLSRLKETRLLSLGIESVLCPTIGVDTSKFKCTTSLSKRRTSLLFVGRLSAEKNPAILVKACSILKREGIRFRLTMLGDGNQRSELIKLISDLNLREEIQVKGTVAHSEIHHFFSKAGIFVLPSTREGVSVALIEAMASGCLCVVSDIADNSALVRHMHNGLTFKAGDEDDLGRKLAWAIRENPRRLVSMTSNARRLVEQNYSSVAVAKLLRDVILSLRG